MADGEIWMYGPTYDHAGRTPTRAVGVAAVPHQRFKRLEGKDLPPNLRSAARVLRRPHRPG
ncbi:hypothetical protein [Phytohabitans aurantiacus]|uniref:Uncharacterized protein n=1 Tax=Phytohabitans aurantiacus TaxID=3016789 RepID=A0ABQ5QWC1_9ACTN|nr:hypothetical protein [Phytohabitans aurantiacus]GLH98202.1 hypothetical protein Pa4123_34770 [Phytohabitans aurantiacus]